ncbi:hypothetical protein [Streptomyces sp. Tu6071]|nr:hypothetical protein [Streptomyces sp. Tu6071]
MAGIDPYDQIASMGMFRPSAYRAKLVRRCPCAAQGTFLSRRTVSGG